VFFALPWDCAVESGITIAPVAANEIAAKLIPSRVIRI
jgi:hypothetical protein